MSTEEVLRKVRAMCKDNGPLCEGCPMEDFCLCPAGVKDEMEIRDLAKIIDEYEEVEDDECTEV